MGLERLRGYGTNKTKKECLKSGEIHCCSGWIPSSSANFVLMFSIVSDASMSKVVVHSLASVLTKICMAHLYQPNKNNQIIIVMNRHNTKQHKTKHKQIKTISQNEPTRQQTKNIKVRLKIAGWRFREVRTDTTLDLGTTGLGPN